MAGKYCVGDTAWIVVSNLRIQEVKVLNYSNGFYTIQFVNGGGGIKLRENRIFPTSEEAQKSIMKAKAAPPQTPHYRSPWDD